MTLDHSMRGVQEALDRQRLRHAETREDRGICRECGMTLRADGTCQTCEWRKRQVEVDPVCVYHKSQTS
jgi:hypothetical protein